MFKHFENKLNKKYPNSTRKLERKIWDIKLDNLIHENMKKNSELLIKEANCEKPPSLYMLISQMKGNLFHRESWGSFSKDPLIVIFWTWKQQVK